jgi:dTDP-4-amino-4,6-dideoxygalactose transaminase
MQVPFFRYGHVFAQQKEQLQRALLSVAERGAFILQKEVHDFEERLAEYVGARHAISVGNATDALELNIAAAGIKAGDEVILPSHTFVASASAVVTAGATPVFAEIAADHLLDPEDVEKRVTPRTRAIMPTQLNGRTAAMDRFRAVADKHNLTLLEDSAQGLGSLYRGKMAGTFGVAGVYSFYPAKTLGCIGDGGAIITNDDALAREVRQRRDHGRDPETGEVVRWGRNTRLDNLQAAVLLVKMDSLDEEIATRRALAQRYIDNLSGLESVVLPPAPDWTENPVHFDVFQNFEIEADDRDQLRAHLQSNGVGTLLQWGGKGVHQFPALGVSASLPRTERMFARALMLPLNTSLTPGEVDYVSEQIHTFYAGVYAGR